MIVYADNAATTRMSQRALTAMKEVLDNWYGNPSSSHTLGVQSADYLDQARERIAECINADPEEIYFTSGGTESNNWAMSIAGQIQYHTGGHAYVSAIEHDSVLKSADIYLPEVAQLPVNEDGRVDP